MDRGAFISIVAQAADAASADAERAARAVLQTLGERIDREEARQLAARLPPELAPWIATTTPAEGFDAGEFVSRVARREGVDAPTARRHAAAVLDAVARAAGAEEWADVAAELPRDFAPLLPRGPAVDVMDPGAFVQRVADRAGLDPRGARRAADAVLEVLAQRIAPGEVEDLIARLPDELRAPLRRGVAAAGGRPETMPLERFLRRVAQREGVDALTAAAHAAAVLTALREAVGDDEFFDVTVQLPAAYRAALLASGGRTGRAIP